MAKWFVSQGTRHAAEQKEAVTIVPNILSDMINKSSMLNVECRPLHDKTYGLAELYVIIIIY